MRLRNGVSPGTGAARVMASTLEKVPSGSVSLIRMRPERSSASMPEMSACGRFAFR